MRILFSVKISNQDLWINVYFLQGHSITSQRPVNIKVMWYKYRYKTLLESKHECCGDLMGLDHEESSEREREIQLVSIKQTVFWYRPWFVSVQYAAWSTNKVLYNNMFDPPLPPTLLKACWKSPNTHDMAWYDIIWYLMTWYDTLWHDMILNDMIWLLMTWYDMIWHGMTSVWFGGLVVCIFAAFSWNLGNQRKKRNRLFLKLSLLKYILIIMYTCTMKSMQHILVGYGGVVWFGSAWSVR
jgi:hypothetical protein